MKSFSFLSVFIMISLILVLCSKVSNSRETDTDRSDLSVEIENLHFTTARSTGNISEVTAAFDLKSESREWGEIQIIIDGRKEVNNRILIKQGDSHYSVKFLLSNLENEEDQHLYSAVAKLSIKGISADIMHQAFGINKASLADLHNENQ